MRAGKHRIDYKVRPPGLRRREDVDDFASPIHVSTSSGLQTGELPSKGGV